MLRLLFFVAVDCEVDQVAGVHLVVLEDGVLVQEHLWALLLTVQVDGVEAFGQVNGLLPILPLRIAIALTDRNLAHDKAELLLGHDIDMPVIANIEEHALGTDIEALLHNLLQLVLVDQLIGLHEGLQDDAALRVAGERGAHVRVRDVVDSVYVYRCCPD